MYTQMSIGWWKQSFSKSVHTIHICFEKGVLTNMTEFQPYYAWTMFLALFKKTCSWSGVELLRLLSFWGFYNLKIKHGGGGGCLLQAKRLYCSEIGHAKTKQSQAIFYTSLPCNRITVPWGEHSHLHQSRWLRVLTSSMLFFLISAGMYFHEISFKFECFQRPNIETDCT